jgi:hypothetical protein
VPIHALKQMAGKPIQYSESIPEQRTKYLLVLPHSVFFCFDVDHSALVTEHKVFIKATMVPFIERAVKRLGPGAYELLIHGSASATGSSEHNFELGARRESSVSAEVIRIFEEDKKKDTSLVPFNLIPTFLNHGDEDAEKDPLLQGARRQGNNKVEKVQAIFRSAVFNFRAEQRKKSATFLIREIYFFKFKKIEQPMPEILKQIDDALDNAIVKFVVDLAIKQALKKVMEALGSIGGLASHLVTFLIPKTVDYCFEIKDSLKDHALYRFNGVEHKDSFGVMDVISFITKVLGFLKALERFSKVLGTTSDIGKKIVSAVKGLSKVSDELIEKAMPFLEKHLGQEAALQIKNLFLALRGDARSLIEAISVPGSGFTPFHYHDGQADHDVKQLAKPARRVQLDAFFFSRVDISFGGSASPTSTAFAAEASIVTSSILFNSFFTSGTADGVFIPVKLGYLTDIAPGPFDPVSD